jgi:hypothetical protein
VAHRLPREREVTAEVPVYIPRFVDDTRALDRDVLCHLLVTADHAYVSARFFHWADPAMSNVTLLLGALAIELYLKAFLVSRLGTLPKAWTTGRRGHDLEFLAGQAASVANSDPVFRDPALLETLRRLTPGYLASRYPRTGFGRTALGTDFINWLDNFAFRLRRLISYPSDCRDDIERLRENEASREAAEEEFERAVSGALREAFFAFNRPFGGWFLTGDGRKVREDGSPWT